jgi:hypothetical protein
MDQLALWANVNAIKRRVRAAIGTELSHEFRSTNVYQAYTGLCGEAELAYADGELDERLVVVLDEYAAKVIANWQQGVT